MKKLFLKLVISFVLVFISTFAYLILFSNSIVNAEDTQLETPSIEILKNNVSYSDSIYIAYAIACEGFEINKNEVSLLFWNQPQDTYLKGTEDVVGTSKGKTKIDGKQCLVFYSEGLAAKHMTDDLIARAYVNINGVEYYSEVLKFSVLEYVYKMKDSGSLKPHQKRLLETLLSYGGAAQNNFDYNTDRLADSNYFRIELVSGTHTDGFNSGLFQLNEVITIMANEPSEGNKFSHWQDSNGKIVSDKIQCEIKVSDKNETYEAIYKPIETIMLRDNLEIDEQFDATAQTLSLPDFITVNNAENEEETIKVSWDTTTFVENQIGEQIIYGTLVDSDYQLENPLSIKVNIFPYTFTFDKNNQTYAINKYYGSEAEVVIPSTYKNLPIVCISTKAFEEVETLINLVIPSSIKEIENGAIYLCDNLVSITIPFIGGYLENSIYTESYFGYIFGASSYSENQGYLPTNLQEVNLLEGIEILDSHAFENCVTIKKVNLPVSLKQICYQSFSNCLSIESLNLPENLNKIDLYAFEKCTSLISITLQGNYIYFDSNIFEGCNNIQNVYFNGTIEQWCALDFVSSWPKSNPMHNGSHFFMLNEDKEYYEVTEIVIPETVTEIKKEQFNGFKYLEKITLPNTIVLIDDYAFYNCTSLKEIEITTEISTIGNYAFAGCTSLAIVENTSTRLIEIGNYAFENCVFTEINLRNLIVSLGEGAFRNCSQLEGITIPSGVTNINNNTFSGCTNLKSISLPSVVYSIGEGAFRDCYSLTSIELPNTITSLGNYVFSNCIMLNNVTLPNNLTSLGAHAFDSCIALTEITIPNGIENLANGVFGYCDNLEKVDLPYNLVSIGDYAFALCRNLEDIIIPNTVTSIGIEAFVMCSNLKSVNIPEGVTRLEYQTFMGCTNITEINLPESLIYIGTGALGCPIDTIDTKNVQVIDSRAFMYSSLKSIILGESLETINEEAFLYSNNLVVIYNLSNLELEIGSIDNGYVAYYAKKIFNKLPDELVESKEEICIDVPCYIEFNALNLPTTIKCLTIDNEEVEVEVYWHVDMFNFDNQKLGIQEFSGQILSDKYYLSTEIVLKLNVLPYDYEYEEDLNGISILTCYIDEKELTIPSTINGVPVIKIKENAFSQRTSLEKVVISEGIKIIEGQAFAYCANLKDIILPSTLEKIESDVFYECNNINFTNYENGYYLGNEENPHLLLESINYELINSQEFKIHDNTVIIGPCVFSTEFTLKEIEIPNNVVVISNYAFIYSTVENIIIRNNSKLSFIGNYAFAYSQLKTFTLPSNLQIIEGMAFNECIYLKTIYNYSDLELVIGSIDNGYIAYYAENIYTESNHKYESYVTLPTCTEEGYTTYVCTLCNDSYVDEYVESLGHDIVIDEETLPTCTTSGLTSGEHCTRCDYKVYQKEIESLGHDIVIDEETLPTCTTSGLTSGEHCTRCDYKVDQEEVLALGHDIVIDEETLPTCTTSGLTSGEHCTRCDYKVDQEEVLALGHDIIIDEEILPTCTTSGLTSGEHCTRCDYKVDQEKIESLGHDMIDNTSGVKPTCTKKGYSSSSSCSRCNYEKNKNVISPTGHNYENNKCTTCSYELFPSNGLEYTLINDNYVVSGIGTCTDENIIIAANYNGKKVVAIDDAAFRDVNLNQKRVYVPGTVVSIGEYAFYHTYISYIYLEQGVRNIYDYAFSSNNGELVINIPSSVSFIDECSFLSGCKVVYLDSETIAKQATCYDAVGYLFHLTKTVMLSPDISYGSYVLSNKSYNGQNRYLGNEYKVYSPSYHPHHYNDFSYFGFNCIQCEYCLEIEDFYKVEMNVSASSNDSVKANIYRENNELVLKLSGTGNIYAESLWSSYNAAISKVIIEEGITSLPNYAFAESKIKTIDIPSSILKIGKNAFGNCSNLESINVSTDNPNYTSIDGVLFSKDLKTIIKYPNGKQEQTYELNDNVEIIEENCFDGTELHELCISHSVTTIKTNAIKNCNNLVLLYIPTNVINILDYAISVEYVITENDEPLPTWNSSWLENITNIFYNIETYGVTENGLCWIKVGDKICIIKYTGVELDVTIPSEINGIKVNEIYKNCFKDSKIKNVIIEEGIEVINDYAFSNCMYLENIELASTITYLGKFAFYYCYNLNSIYITDAIDYIGDACFYNCSRIVIYCENSEASSNWSSNWNDGNQKVIFGMKNTIEENETLYALNLENHTAKLIKYYGNATELKIASTIIFNDEEFTVTIIEYNAFRNCNTLKVVEIPSTVTKINTLAFAYCTDLKIVQIPNSVKFIGTNAFYNVTYAKFYCESPSKPIEWMSSWKESSCKVYFGFTNQEVTYTFEVNGGQEMESITSKYDITTTAPIYEGMYFVGWYLDSSFNGSPISRNYYSNTDTTLYAKWISEEESIDYFDGTTFYKAVSIEINEPYSVLITEDDGPLYIRFTALETRKYRIYSSSSDDAFASLYNLNQELLISNDDINSSDYEFYMEYDLIAGQTYILRLSTNDDRDSFNVHIE